MEQKLTYKDSGVDKHAGYRAVDLMKKHVKETYTPGVIGDLGSFSGLFALDKSKYEEPVLVSGTDGVGTKLMIAFKMDKHDTIGEDCVAMCVNDILCQGATPLLFLDYIATGKLVPEKIAQLVYGIANGCKKAGAALIGGETAEMPGLYAENDYDMAGFSVGIVDRKKIINGSTIKAGDAIIGLASSGVHSNGYSLVRKIVFDFHKIDLHTYYEELGCTIGEELLKPTRIYVKSVLEILNNFEVKGLSHITGGGFYENIPRMFPECLMADIDVTNIPVLPIFKLLQKLGNIETKEMYGTFNMGIGMVMAVNQKDVESILKVLQEKGEKAYLLGKVVEGNGITVKF